MQQQTYKDEKRLFDQVHIDCCQCRLSRRRVSEALRRIKDWFNKEFTPEEILPKEFRNTDRLLEYERMESKWNRFL